MFHDDYRKVQWFFCIIYASQLHFHILSVYSSCSSVLHSDFKTPLLQFLFLKNVSVYGIFFCHFL